MVLGKFVRLDCVYDSVNKNEAMKNAARFYMVKGMHSNDVCCIFWKGKHTVYGPHFGDGTYNPFGARLELKLRFYEREFFLVYPDGADGVLLIIFLK